MYLKNLATKAHTLNRSNLINIYNEFAGSSNNINNLSVQERKALALKVNTQLEQLSSSTIVMGDKTTNQIFLITTLHLTVISIECNLLNHDFEESAKLLTNYIKLSNDPILNDIAIIMPAQSLYLLDRKSLSPLLLAMIKIKQQQPAQELLKSAYSEYEKTLLTARQNKYPAAETMRYNLALCLELSGEPSSLAKAEKEYVDLLSLSSELIPDPAKFLICKHLHRIYTLKQDLQKCEEISIKLKALLPARQFEFFDIFEF